MARLVLNLPPVPSSVPHSRHRVRAWLDEAGADMGSSARDAVLVVVTELVTNGVLHDGGHAISVTADTDDRAVTIDVQTADRPDEDAARPGDDRDPAECGRGLHIVGALTEDMTTEIAYGRRRVRCRVPYKRFTPRNAHRAR